MTTKRPSEPCLHCQIQDKVRHMGDPEERMFALINCVADLLDGFHNKEAALEHAVKHLAGWVHRADPRTIHVTIDRLN